MTVHSWTSNLKTTERLQFFSLMARKEMARREMTRREMTRREMTRREMAREVAIMKEK